MKSCTCKTTRPHPSPTRRNCVRCGFVARPEPEPEPVVHHCARCGDDLVDGQSSFGMLYFMDANWGAKALSRFCRSCHDLILEGAVTYRTPEQVEIANRGAP
jgi:hypothetical protein